MATLDLLPTLAQVRYQADQLKMIPPEIVADFTKNFGGAMSDDFYLGMFQGVAASIVISQTFPVLVPVMMAFLADVLVKREIVIKDPRYKDGG